MFVVGLDRHRAQVIAGWLDSATGEVSRARVAPAHRESVRRFLSRFAGQVAPVPRLALRPSEAAKTLGMSYDSFVLYVRPHVKCVRLGSLVLYPVREIERLLDERASSVMDLGER